MGGTACKGTSSNLRTASCQLHCVTMQYAHSSFDVFADVLSFTQKKEGIYTDTLPHLRGNHCAVCFTYSRKCFSVPPMNLASKWSRQIKLWKWKRGPRSPLQESNRTHLPFCSQVTVCPVSFITALIRWHFTNLRNRHCPFPYLQEGCLQVRKLDYNVCWVCEGKNEILQLLQFWYFLFSSST